MCITSNVTCHKISWYCRNTISEKLTNFYHVSEKFLSYNIQFENCSIVWRPTSSSLTKKLESLQKRAIKWILSEEGHSYSPELYVQKCKFLDILPLSAKFDLNDLLFFHKVVNDLVPISLPSYLSFYQGGSRLRSCHLDKLSIVSSLIPISSQFSDRSNNPFSKSFFYRTHLLWNNLSLELREILCPSLFKLEISKHLWNTLLTTNSPNFDDDFGWVLILCTRTSLFFLFLSSVHFMSPSLPNHQNCVS